MGIPLLIAMYGDYSGSLMVQVVVLQCIIWYTLLLFLFEYRGAKMLIMEQFPETAASIVSFKVDSDVVSLDGRDFLETDAEIGDDGKLHVTVRKSNASRRSLGPGSFSGLTPRPSNLTGAEIYSLSSSRNPTPRGSNFNPSDFYSMMGVQGFPGRPSNFGQADLYSVQSSRGPTPRPSSFEENCAPMATISSPRFGFYPAQTVPTSYPAPNPEFASTITSKHTKISSSSRTTTTTSSRSRIAMQIMMLRNYTCSCGAQVHRQSPKEVGSTSSAGLNLEHQNNLDGLIRAPRKSGCWLLTTRKMGIAKPFHKLEILLARTSVLLGEEKEKMIRGRKRGPRDFTNLGPAQLPRCTQKQSELQIPVAVSRCLRQAS
ncbi:hypothetical protein OIU78_007021 [Salix suchowensis]|nr:hypothetical protein OIU78_007021 [Salix suchowensis]